ncbi:uncharacterized protein LOC119667026 [Teleopsis dalmanni]|uniref:uncharacterized protein LOC119667026 n=1 Tax=Teleopsis dalmanni TaxID=139649 RepID=UPI0018CF9B41|nr:uncharacterized protein LOC119667026 [Teleopsis dalmanni]
MSRHILWGLALALLVLTNSSSATELTDNTALGISPLRSDLAFQFYNLGSQYLTGAQKIIPNVSEKCSIDIIRIAEGVKKIEEWALEFPDSWGRAPMGLMWGHTSSFGQYEECIAATRTYYLSDDKEETVDGQYCLAKVPIHKFMEDMVKRNETTGTMKISYKYSLPKIFELGVCVPKTCTVDDTNEILKQVLRAYIPDKYDINDNTKMIEEGRCDYKKPVELRGIDIFAICFFAIIIFIMLVSSIYDYVQTEKKQPKKPLFIAFSVLTNAPKIFTVKRVNNPNVIHCLNGCLESYAYGYYVYT